MQTVKINQLGDKTVETIFWRNYTRLCDAHWTLPTAVGRELRFPSGTVTGWKNGKLPTAEELQKIAEHFSVSEQVLLHGEAIDDITIEIMKAMKYTTPEKRRAVLVLLDCAPTEPKTPSPKPEMQTRIDEAADSLMKIIRQYSESSEYLATSADVVVQAATVLAELAKIATK